MSKALLHEWCQKINKQIKPVPRFKHVDVEVPKIKILSIPYARASISENNRQLVEGLLINIDKNHNIEKNDCGV